MLAPMSRLLRHWCPLCEAVQPYRELHDRSDAGFTVVSCRECDMVYCVESPPHGEMFEFTGIPAEEGFEHWRPEQLEAEIRASGWYDQSSARYLGMLERCEVEGRRLLEIGASFGPFLTRARAHGWEAEGVDVSGRAVEVAREYFGVDVIHGSEAAVAGREPYDVVVGLDVIEHQLEPRAFLRRLRPLVRPGGALLLKTPNHECLYARLYGPMTRIASVVRRVSGKQLPWASMYYHYEPGQRFQSGHAIHFSPRTLQRALEAEGFEVISEASEYSDIGYIVARGQRSRMSTMGLRAVDLLARLTRSPNKMVMVARRIDG